MRTACLTLLSFAICLATTVAADGGPDAGFDSSADSDTDSDNDTDADIDAAPDAGEDAGEAGPLEPVVEMVCKCEVVGVRAGWGLIRLLLR